MFLVFGWSDNHRKQGGWLDLLEVFEHKESAEAFSRGFVKSSNSAQVHIVDVSAKRVVAQYGGSVVATPPNQFGEQPQFVSGTTVLTPNQSQGDLIGSGNHNNYRRSNRMYEPTLNDYDGAKDVR